MTTTFLSAEQSTFPWGLMFLIVVAGVNAAVLYFLSFRIAAGAARNRARRLGHVCAALTLVGIWAAGGLVWMDDVPIRSVVLIGLACGAPVALVALVVTTRRRRGRQAGPRHSRTPFVLIGKVMTFAIPAGIVIIFATGGPQNALESRLYVLIVPFVTLASLFLDAGLRRQKAELEANAGRVEGAVVYIRGFDRELDLFAHTSGNHEENNEIGIIYKPDRLRRGQASFAEFLEPTAAKLLGPWRHMGNLNDRLPPHGGTPTYTADKEWREEFAWLVEHSRCIITFPHPYRQLSYELAVIRKAGAHQRLFLLTPPQHPFRRDSHISDTRQQSWEGFAGEAAEPHEKFGLSGYFLGDNPGPGAVVAFDDMGNAVVLRQNAKTPAEYVSAIQSHLDATKDVVA